MFFSETAIMYFLLSKNSFFFIIIFEKNYLSIEITYHLFIAAKIHLGFFLKFTGQNVAFHHSAKEKCCIEKKMFYI